MQVAAGRHEPAPMSVPGVERWVLPAAAVALVLMAALGGTEAAQRTAGVLVTITLWSVPFVLGAVALAASGLPRMIAPSRLPWLLTEPVAPDSDAAGLTIRLGLGLVVTPTVVLGGLVDIDRLLLWLLVLALGSAATFAAASVASWPNRRAGLSGRHDCTGRTTDIETGDVPDDFVKRCSESATVSLRFTVVGAVIVAAATGPPPDAWIVWLQEKPLAGVLVGFLLGVVFPPVPEAVAASVFALTPFGPGAQIAFGVSALVGNLALARHLSDVLPRRTVLRYLVVVAGFAVAGGIWGTVLG